MTRPRCNVLNQVFIQQSVLQSLKPSQAMPWGDPPCLICPSNLRLDGLCPT